MSEKLDEDMLANKVLTEDVRRRRRYRGARVRAAVSKRLCSQIWRSGTKK